MKVGQGYSVWKMIQSAISLQRMTLTVIIAAEKCTISCRFMTITTQGLILTAITDAEKCTISCRFMTITMQGLTLTLIIDAEIHTLM